VPAQDLSGREPLAALDDAYPAMADEFTARLGQGEPGGGEADTASFWVRRMVHETAIHRVDAELAVGLTSEPIETDLAVDGIDELLTVFLAQETQQWTEQYASYLREWPPDWLLVSAGATQWRITVRPHGAHVTSVPAEPGSGDPPGGRIDGPPDPLLRWAYNRGGGEQVSTAGDAAMIRQFTRLLTAVTSVGALSDDGLDVDDGGAVERLKLVDADAVAVDLGDPHGVQADWVRAVGGAGAEHSGQGQAGVVTRMHGLHVPAGSVQPGQHDDLGADLQIGRRNVHGRVQDEPGVRRTLVALPWRERAVGEWRFNPSDGPQFVAIHDPGLAYL
jgi:hypothetical protein